MEECKDALKQQVRLQIGLCGAVDLRMEKGVLGLGGI
jgi:hypothetical protein